MIVHPDNMPRIERHFEAMLVWMDEKAMNPNTQFYIKHTTNTTKARFDQIKYKVDVNTMEKSDASTSLSMTYSTQGDYHVERSNVLSVSKGRNTYNVIPEDLENRIRVVDV